MLGTGLLLAFIFLLCLLRERRHAAIGAGAPTAVSEVSSSPSDASAAERARRAAIAALGPIKHKGVNAADLYRNAMGLYAGLTDAEKNLLKHWREKQDPKSAAALYAKIQPIMDLLRSARKADYVDWALEPMTLEDSSNKAAQLTQTQHLAVLAAWDSNYRFQSDPDGAVGDVAAMEAMGRTANGNLIGLLVEEGIHGMGITVLAQNAGSITGAAGPDLGYIVNPASAGQSFQDGMDGEAAMLQAELDDYANPATRNESYVQRWVSSLSMTPQEAESEMEWTMQMEEELGKTLMEPQAQFQQWWTQKLSEAPSMPLIKISIQAVAGVRTSAQASLAQSAMLEAGLALEQNDKAGFQAILDPVSGRPFTYKQPANGFQLASALVRNGKPVTLSFPAPVAK